MVSTALSQANIHSTDYGFEKPKAMISAMTDFEVFSIDDTAFVQRRTNIATPEPYDSNSPDKADLALNAEQQHTTFVNVIAHGIAHHQDEFGWAPIGRVIVFARQQFGMEASDYGYNNMNEALANLSMFETTSIDDTHYARDIRTTPDEWANKLPTPKPNDKKPQTASQQGSQKQPVSEPSTPPHKQVTKQTHNPNKKLSTANHSKIKTLLTKAMVAYSQEFTDNWFSLTALSTYLRQHDIDPKSLGHKNFVYLMNEFNEFEHKLIENHHYYKDPNFITPPIASETPNTTSEESTQKLPINNNEQQTSNNPESVESVENQAPSDNDSELAKLLTIIDEAIATYANGEGLTKIGDIGKFVRKTTGLGSQSFGYADFGKLLDMLPNYQVIRQGRYIYAKKA